MLVLHQDATRPEFARGVKLDIVELDYYSHDIIPNLIHILSCICRAFVIICVLEVEKKITGAVKSLNLRHLSHMQFHFPRF